MYDQELWDAVFSPYWCVRLTGLLTSLGVMSPAAFRQPCVDTLLEFRNHVHKILDKEYGGGRDKMYLFTQIKQNWTFTRTVISLQLRLIIEQVFYDLGQPWRQLVTGFSPMK